MNAERYETRRAALQDKLDAARAVADRLERRLKMLHALNDTENETVAREVLDWMSATPETPLEV